MFYGSLDEKGNDQVRLLIQGLGKFQVHTQSHIICILFSFVLFLIPLQLLLQIAARKMPFIDADTVVALGDMLVSRAKECNAEKHRRYRTFVPAANGAC